MQQPNLFDLWKQKTTTPTDATPVAQKISLDNGDEGPTTKPSEVVSSAERGEPTALTKRLREDPTANGSATADPDTDDEAEAVAVSQSLGEAAAKRARKNDVGGSGRVEALILPPKAIAEITTTAMAQLLLADGVFNPNAVATWPKSDSETSVPFAYFADVLADISATSGRLQCQRHLTRFFWAVLLRSPADLLPAVYLASNKLAPAHEGVELGIGDALLVKVISEVCGMTEARLKEEYRQTGDLAEVAQAKKAKVVTLVKPKPLLLSEVFKTYREIATASGKDVQTKRQGLIRKLMRDAKGPEVNFIVRGLQGKMRIGMAEPTVIVSLGYALELRALGAKNVANMTPEALQAHLNLAGEVLSRIFHEVPSWDIVLPPLLEEGIPQGAANGAALPRAFSIRPGLPVRPMLAHPTTGITKILDRFQGKKFTCEYKYDGERAQIHYQADLKEPFSIFSRNSETHTTKYPDIIHMMPSRLNPEKKITSFILDTEAVAVGPNGELQAFQVLQHRSRKGVSLSDITIPVCVFAFDLLYLNGVPLLELTLEQRREKLAEYFIPEKGKLQFATQLNSDDVEEVQAFLAQSVVDGCEGLMVKTLTEDATYQPAKRSYSWLKLKKDYMEGCGDTLDLVPIGAFYGKGKRTGVLGGFLLACYDASNDEYQSICKIGTGFSDSDLETLTASLMPTVIQAKPRHYLSADAVEPDVWLADQFVWEIKAADLSISPVHKAAIGIVAQDKGIALRFPRFLRVRDDKGPQQATTASQVATMYQAQALALGQEPADNLDEE
jgi:DNA ligase-1